MTTTPTAARQFLDRIGGMDATRFMLEWPLLSLASLVRVGTQEEADAKIPRLLQCDRTPRIVWAELRGPVDFTPWLEPAWTADTDPSGPGVDCPAIDWLILSGSSNSPTDLAWLRKVIADCRATGVPCYVRSLGSRPYQLKPSCYLLMPGRYEFMRIKDPTGSDPSEWPSDLAGVRDVPRCFEEVG